MLPYQLSKHGQVRNCFEVVNANEYANECDNVLYYRSLGNEEVNKLHSQVTSRLVEELHVELR